MTNEEFQKIVLDKLSNLEGDVKGLKDDVVGLKSDVNSLKESQNRIEKKLNSVCDQTANLMEFRTETKTKLDTVFDEVKGVRKDLSAVEIITANNYAYIANLKAVK